MPEHGRSAEEVVRRALRSFRAVLIAGPRQSGKTTLAKLVGPRAYVSLDDLGVLQAALADPEGFVRGLPRPVTLDEVQRAPKLLLPIKRAVDARPGPGQFLLTGSADPTAARHTRETLAGRMAVVHLRPLTWAELAGRPRWNPLDVLARCRGARDVAAAFGPREADPAPLARLVPTGGFPEPALRLKPRARAGWYEQYALTYLERDIPQIVRPDDIAAFYRFVRLAAAMTGGLLNLAHLARDASVSTDTSKRWLSGLQTTYVAELLPPWWRNVRKRLAKSPKLHLADAGLAMHLIGVRDWSEAERLNLAGPLTETWVHAQLQVFRLFAKSRTSLHHFRTAANEGCDFVVETGRLVPIEVRSGATPTPADAKGLRAFLGVAGRKAPFGILLHAGTSLFPLADRVVAVPMSSFLRGQ